MSDEAMQSQRKWGLPFQHAVLRASQTMYWHVGLQVETSHLCMIEKANATSGHSANVQTLVTELSRESSQIRGADSMVMKFYGNVRGEVRVNFLALCAFKPTFSCAVPSNCPELCANVRLNIAIPILLLSLNCQRMLTGKRLSQREPRRYKQKGVNQAKPKQAIAASECGCGRDMRVLA